MWKLENLKSTYDNFKSGRWDQLDPAEIEAITKYHASQVVLNINNLSEKQKAKSHCNSK